MKKVFFSFISMTTFIALSISVSAQSAGNKKQTPAVPAQTTPVKQEPAKNNNDTPKPDKKLIVIAPNGDELMMIAPPVENKTSTDVIKKEEQISTGNELNKEPK